MPQLLDNALLWAVEQQVTGALPVPHPSGPASAFEGGSGSCSVCSPALPCCAGRSCLCPVHAGGRAVGWARRGAIPGQGTASCGTAPALSPVPSLSSALGAAGVPGAAPWCPAAPASLGSLAGVVVVVAEGTWASGSAHCHCHCTIHAGTEECPLLHHSGELPEVEFFSQYLFLSGGKKSPFDFLGLRGNAPAKLRRSKSIFF